MIFAAFCFEYYWCFGHRGKGREIVDMSECGTSVLGLFAVPFFDLCARCTRHVLTIQASAGPSTIRKVPRRIVLDISRSIGTWCLFAVFSLNVDVQEVDEGLSYSVAVVDALVTAIVFICAPTGTGY